MQVRIDTFYEYCKSTNIRLDQDRVDKEHRINIALPEMDIWILNISHGFSYCGIMSHGIGFLF